MEFFKKNHEEAPSEPHEAIRAPAQFDALAHEEEGVIRAMARKAGKRLAPVAAALSLFVGASTAYGAETVAAQAEEAPTAETPALVEEGVKPKEESKWFERISVAVSAPLEHLPKLPGSDRGRYDLTSAETLAAETGFKNAIYASASASEYFTNLSKIDYLSPQQKTDVLKRIGDVLYETYNEDMATKNEAVAVSDDVMFKSIKTLVETGKRIPSGICGNISVFVAKAARSMGFESWVQDVSASGGGGHVIAGLVVDGDSGKEIDFVNGGNLVRAGTLNYRDALGVFERDEGRVNMFDSFVANEERVLTKVESKAQSVAESFVGIMPTQRAAEELLRAGAVVKNFNGLEVGLSPEVHTLKLTKDHIALQFANFENVRNDPYQSLRSLNSFSGTLNFQGEQYKVDLDTTFLHFSLDGLHNNRVDFSTLVSRLFAEYVDSRTLTKGAWGELKAGLGATFQGAMNVPLGEQNTFLGLRYLGEAALGAQLVYLDPHRVGQFHFGASDLARRQDSDAQRQKLTIARPSTRFNVGGDVKVADGLVLGFDATKQRTDWGGAFEAEVRAKTKFGAAEFSYQKEHSAMERFIPSTETLGGQLSYTGDPRFEVRVLGFKKTEQYKDATPHTEYEAKVVAVLRFY